MSPVQIAFSVPDEAAPAFRAAVQEFSTLIAKKVEVPHGHRQERALTLGLIGVAKLRAATTAAIATEDPFYGA